MLLTQTILLDAGAAVATREELDPLQLMLDASPVVKVVLLTLILMWLACLFIIFAKLIQIWTASRRSTQFLDLFWSDHGGTDWNPERLEGVYSQVRAYEGSPLAAVFRAGYVELAKVSSSRTVASGDLDNVNRALRRAAGHELTTLETMLPFLATTGSTAPFIGLFGTVWGIMNSFIAIHGQRNASLDVVAPGIAEALIATAIGLLAAIPAVMAYNYFVRRIRVLESELDSFGSDYLNIVRRHFLRS